MPTSSGFGLKNYATTINWNTGFKKIDKYSKTSNSNKKVKTEPKVSVKPQKIEEIDDEDYTKMKSPSVWASERKSDRETTQESLKNDYTYVKINRDKIERSNLKNLKPKSNVEYIMTKSNKESKNVIPKRKQVNDKAKTFVPISKGPSLTKAKPKRTDILEIKSLKKDFVEVVESINPNSIISTNTLSQLQSISGNLNESELYAKKTEKQLTNNDNNSDDSIAFTDSSFLSDENLNKKPVKKTNSNNFNKPIKKHHKRYSSYDSSNDSYHQSISNKKDIELYSNSLNSLESSFTDRKFKSKYKDDDTRGKKITKHKAKNDYKSKKNKYRNSPEISFSSKSSVVEDEKLKIDRKGDLNFYIQPKKVKEENKNDDLDEEQLKDLITKIMKKKNPLNKNPNGRVKRTIKTEDTGGDKGYTIYLDKSGVGGGLGDYLLNDISKNINSYNGNKGDNEYNNNNGLFEEFNENSNNPLNRNSYDPINDSNPNNRSYNKKNNMDSNNPPSTDNKYRENKNPSGYSDFQGPHFNDETDFHNLRSKNNFEDGFNKNGTRKNDQKGLYHIKNISKSKNNPPISQKHSNLKSSNDANQIQKRVNREQETQTNNEMQTQTSESINYNAAQTQTEDFVNTIPLITNPIFTNPTNRPVYRIVVPRGAGNNIHKRLEIPPTQFINNSGKTYTTMPGNRKNQSVKLVVKSPKTQYVTKEELKAIRQENPNQNDNFPLNYSENMKKSIETNYQDESLLDATKSPVRQNSKDTLLNNIRKPIKFNNSDYF